MKLKFKTLFSAVFAVSVLTSTFGVCAAADISLCSEAEKGNLEQVKVLCEKNPKLIGAIDDKGRTLLHYAVRSHNFELIKYLVCSGADVNAEDECHMTPMVCVSDVETAKYFVEHGADVYLALYSAASAGNSDVVKYLLEQPDVNVNHIVFLSVLRNNQTALECLIGQGADINHVLFVSASLENMDFVKYLIEEKCADAQSAIAVAVGTGNIDLIEYLTDHGADITKKDDQGNTLLHALVNLYEKLKSNDMFAERCDKWTVSIDYLRSKGVEE